MNRDPRLTIDYLGGQCPLQAEGTWDGTPFYFRVRHGRWQLGLGEDPVGETLKPQGRCLKGELPAEYLDWGGGWITEEQAIGIITRALRELTLTHPNSP